MATLPHNEPGVAFLERQLRVQCRCALNASCSIHDPELLAIELEKYQNKQLTLPLSCTDCGKDLFGVDNE